MVIGNLAEKAKVKNVNIWLNEKGDNLKQSGQDIKDNFVNKFDEIKESNSKPFINQIEKVDIIYNRTKEIYFDNKNIYLFDSNDILKKFNKIISNSNIKEITNIIYNEVDRNLRFKITCLEENLISAFNERKPNYIAEYLYEFCVLANIFYQNNHLSNLEDENKKNDWIYVLNLTNRIIKQLLNLLVIDIPTIM